MKNPDIEPPALREDGLQLGEDREFQERFWIAERGAWAIFSLIVLLALAGLTGAGGPLAEATAITAAGQVEYPRFARKLRSQTITLAFTGEGTRHRLLLTDPFAELFQVENVLPEPERSFAGPQGLVYEFETEGAAPAPVRMSVRPTGAGLARWRITLDDAAPLALGTLILP